MNEKIKQKISEALSASLGGEGLCECGTTRAGHVGREVDGTPLMYFPDACGICPCLSFRAEKEKRESEIKSALETIDWSFLDAGEKEMTCSICGKAKPDVSKRECGYSKEINNYTVMEIICDACEYEHLRDI